MTFNIDNMLFNIDNIISLNYKLLIFNDIQICVYT